MRVLNDFKCPDCGAEKEHFVEREATTVICHSCGGTATKLIRPIRSVLDPISGSFPGATNKWAKDREAKMKEEKKAEQ